VDFYFNGSSWYVSPNGNYSTTWGYPYNQDGRFCFSTTTDQSTSSSVLNSDLTLIKNMGFNTVRIHGIGPNTSGTSLLVKPNNNYSTYFSLLDDLLSRIAAAQLKAILLIGAPQAWNIHDSYKTFLENVANHYKNNTTVFAYSIMAELNSSWSLGSPNDKMKISNWVTEWCDAIKKYDNNHLIYVGPMLPQTCVAWDPLVMPIDFVGMHYYAWSENLTTSQDIVASYLYWTGKSISMPWIIDETGFSGTSQPETSPKTGSEADQSSYSTHISTRTLDCGGKGFSWWQFRDINWVASDGDTCYEKFFGTYRRWWNGSNTSKSVSTTFSGFQSITPSSSRCTKPSSYYNMYNYSTDRLTGYVKDNNNQPIANAVVWAMAYGTGSYITYSKSDGSGYFELNTGTPLSNLNVIWISAPGYSTVQDLSNLSTSGKTYTLRLINSKGWTKKWQNSNGYSLGSWTISSTDKFYKGDFNGDGKSEILRCQTGGSPDRIIMLSFNNNTADWQIEWNNNLDPNRGDGIYYMRNNLVVGDFDGDGKDDIIGFNGNDVKTFKYQSGNWTLWETNNGQINNPQYPLSYIQPYQDYVLSGNFDGVGGDDLLASDLPSGYTTWFKYTSGNSWQWVNSDYGYTNNPTYSMSYMRPYRDQFIVGDFDGDGQDEVLGNDLPNGWMTMFKYENGTWNWKWSDGGNDNCGMRGFRSNLVVGNFDRDNSDELLGLNSTGVKFDYISNQFSITWTTTGSNYFSDWDIYPPTNLYLSIKTNQNSTQQLLCIKGTLAASYSFNTTTECTPLPPLVSSTDSESKEKDKVTDLNPEIQLFPNPALKELSIILTSSEFETNWKMYIYNIQGQNVKSIEVPDFNQRTYLKVNLEDFEPGVYFVKVFTEKETITNKFIKSK
jgi:hypothetical protein